MTQIKFGETSQYREALEALSALKQRLGLLPELKAIATAFLVANEATMPERQFPYVGDPADPRDRAIVEAFAWEWGRFLAGEDIEGDELFPG